MRIFKLFFIAALAVCLLSCGSRKKTAPVNGVATAPDSALLQAEQNTTKVRSDFDFDTTLVCKGHSYLFQTIDPEAYKSDTMQVSVMRDSVFIFTTYINKGNYSALLLNDVNNDEYFDIWFVGGRQLASGMLFLYDPANNTFRRCPGAEDLFEPVALKNAPGYYYSYVVAGCADMNWKSTLFTFRDFKTIRLGYMYGHGCPNEDPPHDTRTYKIIGNNENNMRLVEILPDGYEYDDSGLNDREGLMNYYWNKYYRKFK